MADCKTTWGINRAKIHIKCRKWNIMKDRHPIIRFLRCRKVLLRIQQWRARRLTDPSCWWKKKKKRKVCVTFSVWISEFLPWFATCLYLSVRPWVGPCSSSLCVSADLSLYMHTFRVCMRFVWVFVCVCACVFACGEFVTVRRPHLEPEPGVAAGRAGHLWWNSVIFKTAVWVSLFFLTSWFGHW